MKALSLSLSLSHKKFIIVMFNLCIFSKSGRPPLKKLSDRKAFTRLGHTSIGGSPDLAGKISKIVHL
jgi:hypothetical protein